MRKEVIIIGAGGHAKVIADIVMLSGDTVIGFLDDAWSEKKSLVGFPVLGPISAYSNYKSAQFIMAIGDNSIRKRIAEHLDVEWYRAIHPSSIISGIDVLLGEGTVVMANAVINPGARIGKHCIINTLAVIEHDNIINDYAHIAVGAKLCGDVFVGSETWIGAGATVKNGIYISEKCTIGIGAAVVKNISTPGTYIGIPAQKYK